MAHCPFAEWKTISGPVGDYSGGPFKIVHHTTEGATAEGAFGAYRAKRADPHFTVDGGTVYQHIDTDLAARALRNPSGGVETNRDSAVQIEVVGFAHRPKDHATLRNVARLCRWIEDTHGVPQVWPNGLPRPARDGRDPGGHNRDAETWNTEGGHYGHCHVPENEHWDPGYTADEVEFLMNARLAEPERLAGEPEPVRRSVPEPGASSEGAAETTMPDHADVETEACGVISRPGSGLGLIAAAGLIAFGLYLAWRIARPTP